MPAGPPNSSNGALLLEEPLIRTPYELLRRSHRAAQRQVEREFLAVQSTLRVLLMSAEDTSSAEKIRDEVVSELDQAGERMRGLKRKLEDLQPNEKQPSPLRARLKYLDQLTGTKKSSGAEEKQSNGSADTPSNGVEGTQGQGINGQTGRAHDRKKGAAANENQDEGDSTLDRYIVDYLLRNRRMKAAKALAEKRGIEDLVDIKLFSELVRVEQALFPKQSVVEALAWCGENRGTLKKNKNDLEFNLRLQEFIELCRKRDTAGAIAYSRKNLSPWATSHMHQLQQAMTLLAFGERTGVGLYRDLYGQGRWCGVASQFRETFLNLYALPSQPLLALSLSAGLSSLRVPSCVPYEDPNKYPSGPESLVVPLLPAAPPLHNLEQALGLTGGEHLTAPVGGIASSPQNDLHEHPDARVGNVDCPTCDADIKVLASEVPMSHHVNSTIVCRISGEVMDSQNEPMAFPQGGYVYSSKALAEMAKSNFGIVTCPRTRESCPFSRLRKVYIS